MRALRKLLTPRTRREHGATLVEYALILAVVVVGGLGAIRYLTDQGSAEVADQADCVSTRPPPPSCIRASVTTVTTVTPSSTSHHRSPDHDDHGASDHDHHDCSLHDHHGCAHAHDHRTGSFQRERFVP